MKWLVSCLVAVSRLPVGVKAKTFLFFSQVWGEFQNGFFLLSAEVHFLVYTDFSRRHKEVVSFVEHFDPSWQYDQHMTTGPCVIKSVEVQKSGLPSGSKVLLTFQFSRFFFLRCCLNEYILDFLMEHVDDFGLFGIAGRNVKRFRLFRVVLYLVLFRKNIHPYYALQLYCCQ